MTAPDSRPVFISYASQDAAAAQAVVGALEQAGITCWIAPRDVVPGALYASEIVRAINECQIVVLVLSARSAASAHVGKELERASSKNRRIIALRTDATPLPSAFEYFLSESQWIEVADGGMVLAAAKLVEAVRRHLTPGSAPTSSAHLVHSANPVRPRRTMLWGVAALLVATLAVAAVWKWWPMKAAMPGPAAATAVNAGPTTGPSIAVLPFVNMSSDKEQEYFSDGLSEELLNQLAQIRELRVAGRTSSFSFKGKNEDLRVISEKLGVANILEGSVRKSGKRLRITAQLIQGKDGTHLWSETFDRDISDIFAVQEEIALAVSRALSIRLDVGEMSRANGGTTDIEAYEKFLRARTLLQQIGPAEVAQALRLYREAVVLDPDFARAWAALYSTLVYSLIFIPENSAAVLEEIPRIIERSVTLAPDAWWTQLMLASEADRKGDWATAEATASAAMVTVPASVITGSVYYASLLQKLGRLKEEDSVRERLLQIDSLSLAASGARQLSLDLVGRPADAQAEYQRSKDFAGAHALLHRFQLHRLWRMGASPAAVAAQFKVFLAHENVPMALNRIVAENLGNKDASLAATRRAFDDPSNQDQSRMSVVAMYADHFGDKDLALAALRRSVVDMQSTSMLGLWFPYETGLRADPRFKQILRDLKLADYYRSSGKWPDLCKPVGDNDFECR